MKKVRLTERDIESLVRRFIKEDDNETYGHKSQDPKQLNLFKTEEGLKTRFDELLKDIKDKFNKHLTSIAYNTTNHIEKEIRLWLKGEIGELDKLRGEMWDQVVGNIRNKEGHEKYQNLIKELSDELGLFYDESKIKIIDELFNSKDKIFKNKRGDKDQLKLDFPKKDGKETVSSSSFPLDDIDDALGDLHNLEGDVLDMLDKMSDLELEGTKEYEELYDLEPSIASISRDFYSLYDELEDTYNDIDNAEAEGDEEEVEYLEGHIESLKRELKGVFSGYEDLKKELDDLLKKINKIIKE